MGSEVKIYGWRNTAGNTKYRCGARALLLSRGQKDSSVIKNNCLAEHQPCMR
jgi:hypothetical protein